MILMDVVAENHPLIIIIIIIINSQALLLIPTHLFITPNKYVRHIG